MAGIDDLLPSSDSETEDEENEQVEEALYEQKVPPFLSQVVKEETPLCTQEDVKLPTDESIIKMGSFTRESLWKPNITDSVKTSRKLTSMDDAMDRERFLLRKMGQDELADLLYNKRDVIRKHIQNADEIIFNKDEDISSVRSFIEERYRLHFGLDSNGRPKALSPEEEEERDFLIDHSTFIVKVILRMHNLDPDDYKGEIENFHMFAKLEVFREEKAIRDSELEEMDKERQHIFFRRKAKSEQLARARAGEESSDDDADDVEENDDEQSDRQAAIENELLKQMKGLKLDINPEQVAVCVSEMIAAMNIRSALPDRERASSPPRQQELSEDKPTIDLPWINEGEDGGDEILDAGPPEEVNLVEIDTEEAKGKHEILFDWSGELFPDEENVALGGKRPLDILDTLDFHPKRRAVEKDGQLEQKPMDTAPPPSRLRSCLIQHHELLTDVNETKLSVKERIKWREEFETHSKKKKVVRFVDFEDPRNKCRFYVRPLDEDKLDYRTRRENQLRDVTKQAHYKDYPLSRGHNIIRKHLGMSVPTFASDSHNPEEYMKKVAKGKGGESRVERYSMIFLMFGVCQKSKKECEKTKEEKKTKAKTLYIPKIIKHPSKFLRIDARESKTPNGLRLPAYPGKNDPHIPNISIEARAHELSCFRLTMRQFRQNRAGITVARHLDYEPKIVAGILILSDGLLKSVEGKKLSNAMLHLFHPSQGVEDILEVIDRCSYEELDIRHCVLAWGHDLVAYFQQSPIVAAGRAVAALVHLRAIFEKKRHLFEQEGYRRRNSPVFWLITIPEIGDFAGHFVVFNKIIRALFYNHPHFRLLDWALEVGCRKPSDKRKSPFTKTAVEERLVQLFDLCRRELDLTYFRYSPQRRMDRMISWHRSDYDCG